MTAQWAEPPASSNIIESGSSVPAMIAVVMPSQRPPPAKSMALAPTCRTPSAAVHDTASVSGRPTCFSSSTRIEAKP